MRMSFRQRAGSFTTFAPDAFDSQIGKTIRFNVGDRSMPARIVAAKVSEDRTEVEITIETSEDVSELG